MQDDTRIYDPIITGALMPPDEETSALEAESLRVGDIREGMILGQELRSASGALLGVERQEITAPVLHHLQCWNKGGEIQEPVRILTRADTKAKAA